MDQDLSIFPSEAEPPVKGEQPPAPVVSSATSRKTRVRPPADRMHALDQNVQFLKARSHAHAASDGNRHLGAVTADDATTSSEWTAGRSRPALIRVYGALLAGAMLAAFAGAAFLPAIIHTPAAQTESLPTLPSRTIRLTQLGVAQQIPVPDMRLLTSGTSLKPDVDRRILPLGLDDAARGAPAVASTMKSTFKGHLIVDSFPAGATVLINQRPAGVTPLDLADYPAGSYAIWVEREGYERWTAGVRVQAATTTRVRPLLSSKTSQQAGDSE